MMGKVIEAKGTWSARVRAVIGSTQDHAWPYGATRPQDQDVRVRLIEWAELNNVRYSNEGHCLHWLANGHCHLDLCPQSQSHMPPWRWMDHVTGWTWNGKPAILLAQPYHLYDKDLIHIAQLAKQYGVQVAVTGTGWYKRGTVMVKLWNSTTDVAWC